MNKKKIFQITAIAMVALVLALVLIPVVFKGKIIRSVKQMADESLLAKVDFTNAEVSLFRNFPQLEVKLNELTVSGIHEFEGKKLISIQTLSTSISLSSFWKGGGIHVSEIVLTDPKFYLMVSPTGKANWDISKPSATHSSSGSNSPMQIDLTRVQLINGSFTYRDEQAHTLFSFRNANFELSGALKGNDSKLIFSGKADSLLLASNEKKLISGMQLSSEGGLQANFEQKNFHFLANKFKINQLPLEFQGNFILGDQSEQYDLTVQSNGSSLEALIGFLPAGQQIKLKSFEKGGNLSFGGSVKGTWSDKTAPAIEAQLKLTDGRLKYPSKTNEINKIELEATLSKPQGPMDSLTIHLKKFEALVAGHPFVSDLLVTKPVGNPFLKGDVVGEIDFQSLKNTIPIDSFDISGLIRTSVHFEGPYSAIDKGEYDKFQTKGDLIVQNFTYSSKAFPTKIGIQSAKFVFNSKEISISAMKGKFGPSDFTVDGSFANYWAYLLKNETILGNIQVKSDLLDVTQLMNGGTQTADTIHSDPYVLPAHVDLTVQANVDRMLYNRMEIKSTNGKLIVRDQKLTLDQLSMNLLKGKMVLSGIYAGKEKSPADFNFKIDIRDFDLPTAFQSLAVVRHLLPFAGNSKGTFLSVMNLSGTLGRDYAPYFATLNGNGQVTLKNLEMAGNGIFAEIGKYFRKDLFTNVKINDFTGNLVLTNGAVSISPFTTKVANQEVTVSGSQSLAMDLNYQLNFKVNKNDLATDVSNFIGMVPGTENIEKYPIRIDVVGNMKKPEVKVDLSEAKSLVAKEFTKKANSTLKDVAKKFGLDNLFK